MACLSKDGMIYSGITSLEWDRDNCHPTAATATTATLKKKRQLPPQGRNDNCHPKGKTTTATATTATSKEKRQLPPQGRNDNCHRVKCYPRQLPPGHQRLLQYSSSKHLYSHKWYAAGLHPGFRKAGPDTG